MTKGIALSSTTLVTGCAGFLGSHFVGRPLQKIHRVAGVDKIPMSRMPCLGGHAADSLFRMIEADLTEPTGTRGVPDVSLCEPPPNVRTHVDLVDRLSCTIARQRRSRCQMPRPTFAQQ